MSPQFYVFQCVDQSVDVFPNSTRHETELDKSSQEKLKEINFNERYKESLVLLPPLFLFRNKRKERTDIRTETERKGEIATIQP